MSAFQDIFLLIGHDQILLSQLTAHKVCIYDLMADI